MRKRSSIYLNDVSIKHTSDLKSHDSLSARINRTIERYVAICKSHGVELSSEELEHVASVVDGPFFEPTLIKYLPEEIRATDSDQIKVGALADKLEKVTYADLVALVESIGK